MMITLLEENEIQRKVLTVQESMEVTSVTLRMAIIMWSRHCRDASTAFLSGQCVYI